MDFIKKFTDGENNSQCGQQQNQGQYQNQNHQQSLSCDQGGGFFGNLTNKMNSAAGGG